jgi:hypothetical protein
LKQLLELDFRKVSISPGFIAFGQILCWLLVADDVLLSFAGFQVCLVTSCDIMCTCVANIGMCFFRKVDVGIRTSPVIFGHFYAKKIWDPPRNSTLVQG